MPDQDVTVIDALYDDAPAAAPSISTDAASLARRARRLAAFVRLASNRLVALADGVAGIPAPWRKPGDVELVAKQVESLAMVADLLAGDG